MSGYWEKSWSSMGEICRFHKIPDPVVVDFCRTHLKPGQRVLDLGCGSGRNSLYLSEAGFDTACVDISESALKLAEKLLDEQGLKATFVQGSFDRIPCPERHFDAVVCIAALDHVTLETGRKAMNEIRRVKHQNAPVLLIFDAEDTDSDRLDEARILPDGTLEFTQGSQQGMLFRQYSADEIRDLCGKENMVSFTIDPKGARIVVCF